MILVCGEALIDLFVRTGSSLSIEAAAGGSPFNVAIGLARLGRPVGYLGALSSDIFGDHLAGMLRAEGVSPEFLKRSQRPTSLSFVSMADDGAIRYAFRGDGAADRDLEIADLPSPMSPAIRCIAFGSYSLAVEPVGGTLERLAASAGAGQVISLDPNVRPTLIDDWPAWHRRFAHMVELATIVKASDEDIRHAFGDEADPRQLARAWRAKGVRFVVITRGGKATLAFGAFGEIEVPPHPAAVVDTVGAGDSFHAALLAALDLKGCLSTAALATLDAAGAESSLRFAAAAAAITCSRRGADLPKLAEVESAIRHR